MFNKTMTKPIIPKTSASHLALTSLLAGEHLLIDDVPGTGKTNLAKKISEISNLKTNRIQCTNDEYAWRNYLNKKGYSISDSNSLIIFSKKNYAKNKDEANLIQKINKMFLILNYSKENERSSIFVGLKEIIREFKRKF